MLKLKELAREHRDSLQGHHRRTPAITGELAAIWQLVLGHWYSNEYISEVAAGELYEKGLEALKTAGDDQAGFQSANVPAIRYRELLQAALKAKRCHVETPNGNPPPNAYQWGYTEKEVGFGEDMRTDMQAKGDCIGYVEDGDLYLIPDAAYNVAKIMGRESGDGIAIGSKTMHKRLNEGGFLQTTGSARNTLAIRKVLGGQRMDVLHLPASFLVETAIEKIDDSAPPEVVASQRDSGTLRELYRPPQAEIEMASAKLDSTASLFGEESIPVARNFADEEGMGLNHHCEPY
jgi:hypothetical protein